jgi:type I restriction enzyme M protein
MPKLTRERLNGHLWAAADILRGSIDSSDYKNYIFGFLFLKRLSDRFEEEAELLVAGGEDKETAWNDPDFHQFFVPERARWAEIRKQTQGIGDYLNKACEALEEDNANLEGVLAGIDFNDERRLGDGKQRDSLLARLVTHFSLVHLRNDDFSEPDLLGRA